MSSEPDSSDSEDWVRVVSQDDPYQLSPEITLQPSMSDCSESDGEQEACVQVVGHSSNDVCIIVDDDHITAPFEPLSPTNSSSTRPAEDSDFAYEFPAPAVRYMASTTPTTPCAPAEPFEPVTPRLSKKLRVASDYVAETLLGTPGARVTAADLPRPSDHESLEHDGLTTEDLDIPGEMIEEFGPDVVHAQVTLPDGRIYKTRMSHKAYWESALHFNTIERDLERQCPCSNVNRYGNHESCPEQFTYEQISGIRYKRKQMTPAA